LSIGVAFAQKKIELDKQKKTEEIRNRFTKKKGKEQFNTLLPLPVKRSPIDSSSNLSKANKESKVLQMVVLEGDTFYVYNMASFSVVDLKPYADKEKEVQFRKIKWHVKKVYPYAIIAATRLKTYNNELKGVKSKRKRRRLMKSREKLLKEDFEEVIKKMSRTSGRVLVKLIDREAGASTYDIIKEMRGGFKAFVYQGVGKFYGADLKVRYNPKENLEDEMIERVVQSLIFEGKNKSEF
jgi:hypothetical protein